MTLQHGSQHAYQLTWCQILLIHYTRPAQHSTRRPHAHLGSFRNCRKCCNKPTSDI